MKKLLVLICVGILSVNVFADISFVKGISETNDINVESITNSGDLNVSGNTVLTGTLQVDGVTTINNNLVVTGNGTFTGTLVANTNETINGIDINAGAVSDVTTLSMSDFLTVADDKGIGNSASTERIIFDASGDIEMLGANVGIGTSSPDAPLEIVYDSDVTYDALILRDNDATVGSQLPIIRFENNTGAQIGRFGCGDGAGFIFRNASDSEVVRIHDSGNVGIGVADPDTTLEVFDTTAQIKASYDATNSTTLFKDSAGVWRTTDTGVTVADDATVALPDLTGFCKVAVEGAGDEWAFVHVDDDGVVTLISNSANVVAADTDANLCIFDNGDSAVVKNRLGSQKDLIITFEGL